MRKFVLFFGVFYLVSSCLNKERNIKCSNGWTIRIENKLWRASKLVFASGGKNPESTMLYNKDEYNYWYFRNDTAFDIHYPYSLGSSYKYNYHCDTMFLNGQNDFEYLINFKGSQLLLTTINGIYTKTVYFREETVPDSNNINLLISEKVDWNFFRKKYFFVSDTSFLKMPEYPPIQLDLSKENISSYLIKKDTLFYKDSLDSYIFIFNRFDRDKVVFFDNIIDSVKYTVIYRDQPYNNFGK